jgi:hypothetical protein
MLPNRDIPMAIRPRDDEELTKYAASFQHVGPSVFAPHQHQLRRPFFKNLTSPFFNKGFRLPQFQQQGNRPQQVSDSQKKPLHAVQAHNRRE